MTELASFQRSTSDTHPERRCPASQHEFSCTETATWAEAPKESSQGHDQDFGRRRLAMWLHHVAQGLQLLHPWGHADARRPCVTNPGPNLETPTPRSGAWGSIPSGWASPIPPCDELYGRASFTASRAGLA